MMFLEIAGPMPLTASSSAAVAVFTSTAAQARLMLAIIASSVKTSFFSMNRPSVAAVQSACPKRHSAPGR
jgi:hypothetical protein